MKKFFAILFTAMMLVVGTAFAEEEIVELNWADFESQVLEADWGGSIVAYEDLGVQFYVPDVFSEGEMTEEDVADDMIDYYTTEDESAAIGIFYVEADGVTLEEFAEEATKDGSDVDVAVINGLDAIVYEDIEADAVTVVFATESEDMIVFVFAPASDEEFSAVALVMMASIQPITE